MPVRSSWVVLALFSTLLFAADANEPAPALYGYTAADSHAEQQWESKFRAIPDPGVLRSTMQMLSAHPHHVGSPYDKQNAEWILAHFTQWGWDAHIETFDVLFPTPKERLVELVAPTRFTAKLQEPPVALDPTSNQQSEQLPTYNAYSGDGDVTGPLVYVNYGLREDYEVLDRMGISVKGAIVIARYGRSWRGIKPKVAWEHGAVGCIIYSDPQQDGYADGDVFPKGGLRPPDGVQRGSVMDTQYPGDPLTPGVGAAPGAKRLAIKDAETILKIPVLPISYADAQPLLAAITGRVAPKEWRGSLPLTYHIGPGAAKVHLVVKQNWDTKPVYDVIAKIPGSAYPEQWILRGNHHDAWVNGAEDPISGQVAELEEARALGELLKQGWKPKRTIIYASWDGEEPGLLGSTEWAEEHGDELKQHAVAYINSDSNGRGFFSVSGSHSLEHFINTVTHDIPDPEKAPLSVWQRRRMQQQERAKPEEREEVRKRPDNRIGALGDGSDYAPFLDHLGIASVNLGFGGEDEGGIYHSIYDDFYWYTHFSDTTFVYGRALAQTAGTAVMRLADSDLLPYEFSDMADTIHRYAGELEKLLADRQKEAVERQQELKEGMYHAVSDPKEPMGPPPALQPVPYLNFAPLDNAIAALTRSAQHYQTALVTASAGGLRLPQATLADMNAKLLRSERLLTEAQGLRERPWFKHQIYAPGAYTGYGVKTLPAIREPLEERKYQEADAGIPIVAKVVSDEAALVDSLAAEVESAKQGKASGR
ncbi:MAG TPA: M28 family metallopeptidase [Terriglobales bacterium]|jgi:N-acetylated-alpha-linked acidic dipeptidase|nr:M28 family metallopeptidase [Terriglobales bacterium]